MPHFFINSNQVKNNSVIITDRENYFHISRSLRARTGEKLLLIDENKIQYETTIEKIDSYSINAKIDKFYPSKRGLDFRLYLAQSPLRSDAQNTLIEKATELGVWAVYPIITDNCSLKPELAQKKVEKWNKIMYESSKQCERADTPLCYWPLTIKDLVTYNRFNKIIVFCERISKKTIRDSFKKYPIKKGDKVLVIVGPEGGFSQREFEYFEKSGFEMLTLGNLILRAETAVTVGLGNIIYEYENFNK